MSLAPRERQALAAIETELRRSDPVFAVLLTRLAGQLAPARATGRRFSPRRLARARLSVRGAVLIIFATLFVAASIAVAVIAAQAGHSAVRPAGATVNWTAPLRHSFAGRITR